MQQRLKVLFLPAWYPSEVNPVSGVFVREHARAASLYNDIVVIYVYRDPLPKTWKFFQVSKIEATEEGIRTIRVKYKGVLLYIKDWLAKKVVKPSGDGNEKPQDGSRGMFRTALKTLFRIPDMIVSDLFCYWSTFAAFRKLRKEGWKPDIIHAHVFTAGVPAVLIGRLYRIPVVITEHSTAFPRHLLPLLQRLKARFAMNRARIILPVSDDLRRHIETYGIKNKSKIVPNTVNTEMFYPPPLQREGEKNENTKLLLVGLLTPIKGIPYLLEALSQIKEQRDDFSLNIVGDGVNRGEYEELTKNLGLENMVKFHGLKPKEEVAQFMRNCDFYVQPSLMETFGVTYIEVMACGKPIVTSSLPVLTEIVNEDIGILVRPKDVKALKEAIEYMLDNYQNYSSKKIAQYARERFSYETVGEKLDEVYRRIESMDLQGIK